MLLFYCFLDLKKSWFVLLSLRLFFHTLSAEGFRSPNPTMRSTRLACVVAFVCTCSARPANPIGLPQLDNVGPSRGFPPEYLPSRNFTDTTGNALTLPISPTGYPGFNPIFDFYYDKPVKGLQLIQSIVMGIYNSWRDEANRPLTQPYATRSNPFTQFKFTVWPLVARSLTPEKVGLTYCWMLFSMLQLDRWPSHTATVIKEYTQQIGAIDITIEPIAGAPSVPDNSGVNITNDLLNSDFKREQRWARCFLAAFQLPIIHYPAQLVTTDPHFAPRPGIQKYPFSCGTPEFADRVDLFIYPAANAGSPTQLTWDAMARNLITWLTQVASRQDAARSFQMFQSNVLVAEVSMYLQPDPRGNEAVTATA